MCNYSLSHRPRDLQLKWNGRNIILRLSRIVVYYTRNAFALFHSRGLNNVYQTSNNFHHRDRQSERSKWRYFSILFLINWQVFSFARLSQLSISLYIGYIRRAISFLPFFNVWVVLIFCWMYWSQINSGCLSQYHWHRSFITAVNPEGLTQLWLYC